MIVVYMFISWSEHRTWEIDAVLLLGMGKNIIRRVPHCSTLFTTIESLHKLVGGGKIIVLHLRHAL